MDQKNLKDKLDLLMKQMKQIQNEMDSLQEQQDGSNNLVNTPDIPASTSHQSSPQILSVDPLSTPTTVLSQPSQDTRPIPKPLGNYINIPKTLKISKITLNDYQSHIRDLVKLHVDLNKEYKNQNPKVIDLIVSKFKKRNTKFPDTTNDWAIKMMVKRSINNIRDYYRKKGHENKKVNKVPKRSKNKESADDNGDTNIDQDNGSSDEMNETSSDKYKESTHQIDESDEIANKSDNGKESTQKVPPVTRSKRKQIDNTKNKSRQSNKKNRNL